MAQQTQKAELTIVEEYSKILSPASKKSLEGLYTALGDIQSLKDLKYVKGDQVALQSYKNAAKEIKAFRTLVTKSRKEVAKPFQTINKKLIDFEKDVNGQATEILNIVQTEFKPYIDELERKKQEAKERKEAKEKAIREELAKENQDQLAIINRLQEKSRIEGEINARMNDTLNAVANFSVSALTSFKTDLYQRVISMDVDLITNEQQNTLLQLISETNTKCNFLIDEKIAFLKLANTVPVVTEKVEPKVEEEVTELKLDYKESVIFHLNNAIIGIQNIDLSTNGVSHQVGRVNLVNHLNGIINKFKE